jgi:glycosyltransferase involved in cell wall biosynthesis
LPLISIVTAAHVPAAAYLAETIDSVRGLVAVPGWELEWVVQEDGARPGLADRFKGVDEVQYEANRAQFGIAATRNLALSRASGSLVRVLDADDVLLPNALTAVVPHFRDSRIHWAVGQADDLMPDGERRPWEPALPYGVLPAGQVNRWAQAHGGNWPIHCAGLTMRTGSVRALGGWAGLPADEDIVLFAALCEIADGYHDPAVTWLYRQHPGQVTRTGGWRAYSATGRTTALRRARAIRRLGMTFAGSAAVDAPDVEISVGPSVKEGLERKRLQ